MDIINTILVKEGNMLEARREEYQRFKEGLPFLLYSDIKRSRVNYSKESNWHENLEIQLCTGGSGFVWLNGEKYEMADSDIVIANCDVIHYTGTDTDLTYSCLIISTEFCRNFGLDPKSISFEPIIKSARVSGLFLQLQSVYMDKSAAYRLAKLNGMLLNLLIELAEHYGDRREETYADTAKSKIIKSVISYIGERYNRKITLGEIAGAVLYDKYALCREFKKYTGQTIIDYLNRYRCFKAKELLGEGHSVAETADLCGFDNLSYFGKTFKRHVGHSPSRYKK